MTNTHLSELKYEVQRLRQELQTMKRNYYEIKVQNDEMMHPPLSALLPTLGGGDKQEMGEVVEEGSAGGKRFSGAKGGHLIAKSVDGSSEGSNSISPPLIPVSSMAVNK